MLDDFSKARVLVVGDAIIDSYIQGTIERISPEAPVPVLRYVSRRWAPGGGANVAANIAALGGKATLLAGVGGDEAGRYLRQMLEELSIRVMLVDIPGRPTTCKTRLMAGSHQLIRLDEEHTGPIDEETCGELISHLERVAHEHDVIILSDYRKGLLIDALVARVIDTANALGVPIIVDPKRNDWSIYRGASIITPNVNELSMASGLSCVDDQTCEQAARQLSNLTGARILVTRSEKGMAFFDHDGPPVILPTKAREVFDVSGAGDTVVACLATALGSGVDVIEAMSLANMAAGVAVSKLGTSTVSASELRSAIAKELPPRQHGTVLGQDEAALLRREWAAEGKTVGFTNGCFDLLHPGHISLLEEAAMHCDHLIVGINTDASVSRLKGPSRPIQTEGNRARVLSALSCVSIVTTFDNETPAALIELLRPDVLVKGADYSIDTVVGAPLVQSYGGKVVLARLVDGQSTTNLVKRSLEPEVNSARA